MSVVTAPEMQEMWSPNQTWGVCQLDDRIGQRRQELVHRLVGDVLGLDRLPVGDRNWWAQAGQLSGPQVRLGKAVVVVSGV